MESYRVGDIYPEPGYRHLIDTGIAHILPEGFKIALFIQKPTDKEVAGFTYGSINYGLFCQEKIPFVTMQFQGIAFEFGVNVLQSNAADIKKFFDASSDLLAMHLVDSDTYRIKAFRAAQVDMDYIKELKNVVSEQLTGFIEAQAVDHKIKQISNRYGSRYIIGRAKTFRLPGAR